jgi:hypothetical protein
VLTEPKADQTEGKLSRKTDPLDPRGKHLVRRKSAPLVAVPILTPESITLPDRREALASPGSYKILNGAVVVDVVPAARFAEEYEPVITGGLALTPQQCRELDVTLGLGATASPDTLGLAVGRLARIAIGDIRIAFTPGQLAELKFRADKRGRTVEEELRAVVDRIKDELFWRP